MASSLVQLIMFVMAMFSVLHGSDFLDIGPILSVIAGA